MNRIRKLEWTAANEYTYKPSHFVVVHSVLHETRFAPLNWRESIWEDAPASPRRDKPFLWRRPGLRFATLQEAKDAVQARFELCVLMAFEGVDEPTDSL